MGGVDLAARLHQLPASLDDRLRDRDVLASLVRDVHETLDPHKVAQVLIARSCDWLPVCSWAVVASGASDTSAILAAHALPEELESAVLLVATCVIGQGEEFASAKLDDDARVAGNTAAVAALAWPLRARGRTVGALVALDDAPSLVHPCLPASTRVALGELFGTVAVALDNSLLVERTEALSVTDDLTRLYNSRYLNQVLRRESKRSARGGRPLSLLFVDLDGFKTVNDRFGHLNGSLALVETASVLRNSARETDVVARYGGDEFALVLPETNAQGAMAVAVRVRERIAAQHFLVDKGLDVRLTASVGIATLPETASTPEELMQAADQAMYRVKERGKNGIEMAAPGASQI